MSVWWQKERFDGKIKDTEMLIQRLKERFSGKRKDAEMSRKEAPRDIEREKEGGTG